MTVTASISTADLHRALPRRRTFDGARRLAAVHHRAVVGDWHGGPRLVGDLSADAVDLVWNTEALPASASTSGGSQRDEAQRWVDRLWEQRPGRAVLGLGNGGFYKGAAYTFTDFEQRSYRWPDDREQLLDEALTAAPTLDVYASVLLHRPGTGGRKKDTAGPGAVAWADVDGDWTPERQVALDALDLPAWQVTSGARGGRHIYLPLDETVQPDRLEQINRRLAAALAADDGWERTKVLRLPGTLNHKPRPHGRPSVPVRWVE